MERYVANYRWGAVCYHADEPIPLADLEKGVDEVIEKLTKTKTRKRIRPGFRRFTVRELNEQFEIGVDNIELMARRAAERGRIEGDYEFEQVGIRTYLIAKEIH